MGGSIYGKHRGVVTDNVDPLALGRLRVDVPSLAGAVLNWAMPCVPIAAPNAGMIAIPPINALVWIEFEEGDPNLPIWVGGYWDTGTPPAALAAPDTPAIIFQSPDGTRITVSDDATGGQGGITLCTASGAQLIVGADGIHISNGRGASLRIVGPTLTINEGALEVT
jgi:uncharacterized protein involved in type VI secretion and phage assembly